MPTGSTSNRRMHRYRSMSATTPPKEPATPCIRRRTVFLDRAGIRSDRGMPRSRFRAASAMVVNEYVIQRDQDKQLVFYWYQGRGRVIASEYSGKFWMIADAISRNRTDGSLVRLVTPMDDGEPPARSRLVSFTQLLFPPLDGLLPR